MKNMAYETNSFDVIIDNFAIYCNRKEHIKEILEKTFKVLKRGGYFYSKVWGKKTTGYEEGEHIEQSTGYDLKVGPCRGTGLVYFYDKESIKEIYSEFKIISIDQTLREDNYIDSILEEYLIIATK